MRFGDYPAGVTDGDFDCADGQEYCSECGALWADCECSNAGVGVDGDTRGEIPRLLIGTATLNASRVRTGTPASDLEMNHATC